MKLRCTAATLVGTAVLLTGCGDDLPSRDEFLSQVKRSMKSELSTLEDSGLNKADAEKLFDRFVGCTFDKLQDDETLLRKVYNSEEDSSVTAQLNKKAASCVEEFSKAAAAATTGARNNG